LKHLTARDGCRYRLPTEAEWEYACRAGTSTPYYFGSAIVYTQANVNVTRSVRKHGRRFRQRTTPVGSFQPNGWGLYDMHGNVWEWCADGYEPFAGEVAIDPLAETSGSGFVLRGGSWSNSRDRARSAARHGLSFSSTGSAVGLRVCLDIEG